MKLLFKEERDWNFYGIRKGSESNKGGCRSSIHDAVWVGTYEKQTRPQETERGISQLKETSGCGHIKLIKGRTCRKKRSEMEWEDDQKDRHASALARMQN